jgi:hypothetical protein
MDETFDPSQIEADNALVIKMKDPMQLLFLTYDYIYIGQVSIFCTDTRPARPGSPPTCTPWVTTDLHVLGHHRPARLHACDTRLDPNAALRQI